VSLVQGVQNSLNKSDYKKATNHAERYTPKIHPRVSNTTRRHLGFRNEIACRYVLLENGGMFKTCAPYINLDQWLDLIRAAK
jgi:hypothetical protein